jgi:hypothetical protein
MATTTNLVKELTNKELQQILAKYPEDAKINVIEFDYYLDPYSASLKKISYNSELNTITLEPDTDEL